MLSEPKAIRSSALPQAVRPRKQIEYEMSARRTNHNRQLFRLSLYPANPAEVRRWRIFAGVSIGASGAGSLGILVSRLRHLIPTDMLQEQFIYMALAIAFITGLPLYAFSRVLCISLAELGFPTSLMYLAYALLGVFLPNYRPILTIIVIVVACIFLVLFTSGVSFFRTQQSMSDFYLAAVQLCIFLCLWLYPLYWIWR
ncbi:MAG: hypothetical protein D6690_11120 [Nitrospirae bacterium]|nr:MAG: hypothetical protein D6690_11120 [Nitrospirota bacterium]